MRKNKQITPSITLEDRIFVIRGRKVMIDAHIAELYETSTKRLNEQVKRNITRFPPDFMFQLNQTEKEEVVAICDHLKKLRFSTHLPYAFTEHGITMLSAILHTERAVQMSIFIVRAFVRLREMLLTDADMARKIAEIELKQHEHAEQLASVYSVVKQLIDPPKAKEPPGFRV